MSAILEAIKVRLVMDNLNTHSAVASLYETFEGPVN